MSRNKIEMKKIFLHLHLFLFKNVYLLSGIESFPTVIIRIIAATKLTTHAMIAAITEESKPVCGLIT